MMLFTLIFREFLFRRLWEWEMETERLWLYTHRITFYASDWELAVAVALESFVCLPIDESNIQFWGDNTYETIQFKSNDSHSFKIKIPVDIVNILKILCPA